MQWIYKTFVTPLINFIWKVTNYIVQKIKDLTWFLKNLIVDSLYWLSNKLYLTYRWIMENVLAPILMPIWNFFYFKILGNIAKFAEMGPICLQIVIVAVC